MGAEALWTDDPRVLLDLARLGDVDQRGVDPVADANAAARFVLLWGVCATAATTLISGRFAYGLVLVTAVLLFMSSGEGPRARVGVPRDAEVREMKMCEAPTATNPLANVLPVDMNRPGKLPACPSDAVEDEITRSIASMPLSQQVADSVGVTPNMHTGMRAFYSLPSTTVPNNVENFRNALIGPNVGRRVDHGFDENAFSSSG